jgi:hypothetical protein
MLSTGIVRVSPTDQREHLHGLAEGSMCLPTWLKQHKTGLEIPFRTLHTQFEAAVPTCYCSAHARCQNWTLQRRQHGTVGAIRWSLILYKLDGDHATSPKEFRVPELYSAVKPPCHWRLRCHLLPAAQPHSPGTRAAPRGCRGRSQSKIAAYIQCTCAEHDSSGFNLDTQCR